MVHLYTIMLAWIYLSAAIATEVVGTVFLRFTDGFTRPAPSILVIVTYVLSLWLTALALKSLEISLAYAVWAGVGTAAIAIIGMATLGESVNALKLASIVLVIGGVVGLNLSGRTSLRWRPRRGRLRGVASRSWRRPFASSGATGRQAVTHRAVAEEAGVPLGSTTYYFDSRDDLLGQALEHVSAQEVERYASLGEQLRTVKSGRRARGPADLPSSSRPPRTASPTSPSTSSGSRPGAVPTSARPPRAGATPSSAPWRAHWRRWAAPIRRPTRAWSSPPSTDSASACWPARTIPRPQRRSCGRSCGA